MYDYNANKLKMVNLYGNGLLGRVDYDAASATYSRSYYIKDHLGSIRVTMGEQGQVISAPVSARRKELK